MVTRVNERERVEEKWGRGRGKVRKERKKEKGKSAKKKRKSTRGESVSHPRHLLCPSGS